MYASGWAARRTANSILHDARILIKGYRSLKRDGARWLVEVEITRIEDGKSIYIDMTSYEALEMAQKLQKAANQGDVAVESSMTQAKTVGETSTTGASKRLRDGQISIARACERLQAGEPEENVRRRWQEEFWLETGVFPGETDDQEARLWAKVKAAAQGG